MKLSRPAVDVSTEQIYALGDSAKQICNSQPLQLIWDARVARAAVGVVATGGELPLVYPSSYHFSHTKSV
jgi:hypothetical protein